MKKLKLILLILTCIFILNSCLLSSSVFLISTGVNILGGIITNIPPKESKHVDTEQEEKDTNSQRNIN